MSEGARERADGSKDEKNIGTDVVGSDRDGACKPDGLFDAFFPVSPKPFLHNTLHKQVKLLLQHLITTSVRMKKTLGQMLWEAIETGHVSQTDLCRGLCSTSALSRYLSGERRIDRLLLTALMQRLGLSPDKFGTVLTDEEYRYFDWIELHKLSFFMVMC